MGSVIWESLILDDVLRQVACDNEDYATSLTVLNYLATVFYITTSKHAGFCWL